MTWPLRVVELAAPGVVWIPELELPDVSVVVLDESDDEESVVDVEALPLPVSLLACPALVTAAT